MSAANIWTQGNREHGAEMYIKALEIPLKQIVTIGDMSSDVLMLRNSGVRIAMGNPSADAPDLPIYIDSPIAVDASHIYCRFGDDHNLNVNLLMDDNACPLHCRDTHFVREVADSKALNTMPGPAVILSAGGMLTGGRILHHLKWRLPEAHNAVLFVGYQAEGTRGRALLDGAKSLRIHSHEVVVRAQVARIDALSGNADQDELVRWLGGFEDLPSRVFLVHGEPSASLGLERLARSRLSWRPEIAREGLTVDLA